MVPSKRLVLWDEKPENDRQLFARMQLAPLDIWNALPRWSMVDVWNIYAYEWKECISSDLSAGLVVAIMLIPQSLAYAALAGLPPVTGFSAAIAALVGYALTFGSSGHQAVGPVALMSLLSYEAVHGVVEGEHISDPALYAARWAALSARLALLVGVLQACMGILRAGYLISFLSHPVLAGFTASSAIIIASSQLSKAFGVSIGATSFVWQVWYSVGSRLPHTHGPSAGLFVANMVLFYGLTLGRQKLLALPAVKQRPALLAVLRVIPVALLVVTFNILLVWLAGLQDKGVKVLGSVQGGLPQLTPALVFSSGLQQDLLALIPSGALISLITYVESASVAKTMATKYGVPEGGRGVDGNQELLGLGVSNVASALFAGFPVTGGFSRSGVQAEAGSRTVLTGAIAAVLLTLIAGLATSLFRYLPDVCLAALIIFSALRLLESQTIRFLWQVDRSDAAVYLLTLFSTLAGGVENGLLVGAALSIARIVREAAQPHTAVLGRMPDGVTYRNLKRFPDLAKPVPGLHILRLDGPLFFANVGLLRDKVLGHVKAAAGGAQRDLQAVVLDFSGVSTIDSSGVHMVSDLPAEMSRVWQQALMSMPALPVNSARAGVATAAEAGALPASPPQLFVVAARGPVRDRLMSGLRAHAHAHASSTRAAGKPVEVPADLGPTNAAGVGEVAEGDAHKPSLGLPGRPCAPEEIEAASAAGGAVQARRAAGQAAKHPDEEAAGGGTMMQVEREGASLLQDPVSKAVLEHPAEAAVLLWQADLATSVQAVLALLERDRM